MKTTVLVNCSLLGKKELEESFDTSPVRDHANAANGSSVGLHRRVASF
jgi:hypothetical protein